MLVPVDDELALADRLTELLADPELARTIGERGRRFCMETRSIEVIDARLRELYSAAARERSIAFTKRPNGHKSPQSQRVSEDNAFSSAISEVRSRLSSSAHTGPARPRRDPAAIWPAASPRAGLLVQDLGWGQQLAPHERAEAPRGVSSPSINPMSA